jgi:2-phosphoglycerate kinase
MASETNRLTMVRKRDGRLEPFSEGKLLRSIDKAIVAVTTKDGDTARGVAAQVVATLEDTFSGRTPSVDDVSDAVETVLMQQGLMEVAKAFILPGRERASQAHQGVLGSRTTWRSA